MFITGIILFILSYLIINLLVQQKYKQPLNIQYIYNIIPTCILIGLLGLIFIDFNNNKVNELINLYKLNISISTARIISLGVHLFLIIVPIVIVYSEINKIPIIKNNYRFIIPIIVFILYLLIIYPKTITDIYLL